MYIYEDYFMTLEELKVEAKKQGCRLVKIPKKIVMLPCPVCGAKRTEQWFNAFGTFRKCCDCDFRGDSARTDRKAKNKWNEAVTEYEGRKDNCD